MLSERSQTQKRINILLFHLYKALSTKDEFKPIVTESRPIVAEAGVGGTEGAGYMT